MMGVQDTRGWSSWGWETPWGPGRRGTGYRVGGTSQRGRAPAARAGHARGGHGSVGYVQQGRGVSKRVGACVWPAGCLTGAWGTCLWWLWWPCRLEGGQEPRGWAWGSSRGVDGTGPSGVTAACRRGCVEHEARAWGAVCAHGAECVPVCRGVVVAGGWRHVRASAGSCVAGADGPWCTDEWGTARSA